MNQTILTNARVVTRDAELYGTVVVRAGRIATVDDGRTSAPGALDLDGDYLLPGLVELHTDNLEKYLGPRPGVRWPAEAALVAHDLQIVGSGITTVFDAVTVGEVIPGTHRLQSLGITAKGLAVARSAGMLKADHFLHMRMEVSYPDVVELFLPFLEEPLVRLVSLMDHTPGQRQFADESKYRLYYQSKYRIDDAEYDRFSAHRKELAATYSAAHRRRLVDLCRDKGWPLASHDDATPEHVADSLAHGMTIAEFPTTVAAAEASHRNGMKVLMGAPNVVRGGSHSGNVSAADLFAQGVVDILSSDYYPQSLLHAAFLLTAAPVGIALPRAIATVSATPAAAVGLDDRGEIASGRRADLVRARPVNGVPLVRGVWRDGERVA